ncbi:hypothetical protein TZ53_12460 [Sphingobium sp. YBL2]|nr:hypothetical protein TZ53_12460 [Sphingobium sp. YBL2]
MISVHDVKIGHFFIRNDGPSLAITCLDQARNDRLARNDDAEVPSGPVREMMAELEMATRLPWTAEFWAPSNE